MEHDIRKRTYRFAVAIVKYIDGIKNKGIHWSVYDQLLRSGTSIGANVHEGQGASSRKDFIRFYEISLKSFNETAYWLSLIRDAFGESDESISTLQKESQEIRKMLAASILTLKGRR